MTKWLLLLALAFFADDPLTFDVASVKPSDPAGRGGIIRQMPGNQTYHIQGATLRLMMTVAYTVTDRQISGGPAWMNTDRFDIEAKAARPRTSDELHIMLQHLLEQRFQLKVRHETRQESVWALTVNKGGPKMPVHDPDDLDHAPFAPQVTRGADGGICPGLVGKNVSMDYFAFFLSRTLDRAVIDRTGLTARYDVDVKYVPDGPAPATISSECTDVFSAVIKQLGLKLESAKGPVQFLVVDRVEKPSEN